MNESLCLKKHVDILRLACLNKAVFLNNNYPTHIASKDFAPRPRLCCFKA